jgi:hypothetical protein
MDVHIDDLVGTVRSVDGDALLTPQLLDRIVRAVLHEIEERRARERHLRSERRITAGVSHELSEEEGD